MPGIAATVHDSSIQLYNSFKIYSQLSFSVPYVPVVLSRISDYLVWDDEDILAESL